MKYNLFYRVVSYHWVKYGGMLQLKYIILNHCKQYFISLLNENIYTCSFCNGFRQCVSSNKLHYLLSQNYQKLQIVLQISLPIRLNEEIKHVIGHKTNLHMLN